MILSPSLKLSAARLEGELWNLWNTRTESANSRLFGTPGVQVCLAFPVFRDKRGDKKKGFVEQRIALRNNVPIIHKSKMAIAAQAAGTHQTTKAQSRGATGPQYFPPTETAAVVQSWRTTFRVAYCSKPLCS